MNLRLQRAGLAIAAPVLALVLAFVIISLVLIAAGDPVGDVWRVITTQPAQRNWANIIDKTTIFYLSGIAVAIGFKMNLFNIGVEGQFLMAALFAAYVAGEAWLPGYFNTGLAFIVAMLVGALYAGIAGFLRSYRGVSEVISTIMLNAVAIGTTAFLVRKLSPELPPGSYIRTTKEIPEESWIPTFSLGEGPATDVSFFVIIAVVVGFVYWFLLSRTTFGFNLRATGKSTTAAVASGVNVKRMMLVAMMLSGAFAALVGLPYVFGDYHSFGSSFPKGLGFTGIAVALIGRNHPVGVAFGAFLFAFLEEQSSKLQIEAGVSSEIVKIMQGTILLTVVISYEVVRRYGVRLEQQRLAAAAPPVSSATQVAEAADAEGLIGGADADGSGGGVALAKPETKTDARPGGDPDADGPPGTGGETGSGEDGGR